MATRKPTFSQIVDEASVAVQELGDVYVPTDDDRRLRALFLTAQAANPLADADKVTAALVAQVTGEDTIYKRWSRPGFKQWFLQRNQLQAKAEYALDLLIDSFIDLARTDDPRANAAKVAAAKLLADMRGYTGRTAAAPARDDDIPKDPAQLEEYVRRISLAVAAAKDSK